MFKESLVKSSVRTEAFEGRPMENTNPCVAALRPSTNLGRSAPAQQFLGGRIIVASLFAALTLLGALASPAFAQTPLPRAPQATAAPTRDALVSALARAETFTTENQQYQRLPEARALARASRTEPPARALARMGAAAGNLIETKGHFVLYRAGRQATAQLETDRGETLYPVVLNTGTGGIGILPGTLIVQPRNLTQSEALATDHGLELVRAYPHLKTAIYRVKPGQDILAAAAALKADARVAGAEVEVVEHIRAPR